MLCSSGYLRNAVRLPLGKCIKTATSSQNLLKSTGNRTNYMRWATSSARPYHTSHGFTMHTLIYRSRSASLYPTNLQRGLSTSPITTKKLFHRIRQVGKLVLVIAAGGAALAVLYIGIEAWTILRPPQLSLWPEKLREDLCLAWLAKKFDLTDSSVEPLSRVWETIQDLPLDSLGPNPSVRFLSIAICLSEALRENNQGLKAYKVLTDAVALCRTRFHKSSLGPDLSFTPSKANIIHGLAPSTTPDNTAERRCLVFVFLNLASLSQRYDPAAEGKWLSSAVRETVGLLPLCRDIPTERFLTTISSIQDLSDCDSSFSELSNQDRTERQLAGSLNERNSIPRTETKITVDDLHDNGTGIPLPTWMIPNMDTAAILVFEQVGLYAEKHDRLKLALSTYSLASDSLIASTPDIDVTDSKFDVQHWGALSQIHRILNRQTNVNIHLLESEITLMDWFTRFRKATDAQLAAKTSLANLEKARELHGDEWYQMPIFLKSHRDYMREMVITSRNDGMWHEKFGNNEVAKKYFTFCLRAARIFGDREEEEKSQACLERIERSESLSEGVRTFVNVTRALQKEMEEMYQQIRLELEREGERSTR